MRPEELHECASVARELGLKLHSHLSETVHYQDAVQGQHGLRPVEFCETVGWLGPDVWYAHLVKLDPQEIALLGKTRTGIAHCPQSNARLGSGIAPAVGLIVLKVFSNSGSGTFGYIEKALQWVVSNAAKYNVSSVNMSLGDMQNWSGSQQLYGISDELATLGHLSRTGRPFAPAQIMRMCVCA